MPHAPLRLARRAHELECGVDEVARGCLFGRVYAGAVVWAPPLPGAVATDDVAAVPDLPKGIVIRDSKTMSRPQRERAAAWIHAHAYAVHVAHKDEAYVDAHNILRAAQDAMGDAVRGAQADVAAKTDGPTRVERLLVDGDYFRPAPNVGVPHLCVVKGDATFFAIALAAIVAKVAHDAYVQELCDQHPRLDAWYGLRKNVGYGTAAHRSGLQAHGTTPYHRKTFSGCAGVRDAVAWAEAEAEAEAEVEDGIVSLSEKDQTDRASAPGANGAPRPTGGGAAGAAKGADGALLVSE